jgi:hypothetical protein
VGSNPTAVKFAELLSIGFVLWTMRIYSKDTVSEWLRSWTRNPMGFARMGSNPIGVAFLLILVLHAANTLPEQIRSKADLNRHRWIQSPEC